jgi:N-acyl-D-aspartate/D-glutamate deacylase
MIDTLIKNSLIIDGSGAPRQRADIAIRNGIIVDVSLFEGAGAGQVICAIRKIICRLPYQVLPVL